MSTLIQPYFFSRFAAPAYHEPGVRPLRVSGTAVTQPAAVAPQPLRDDIFNFSALPAPAKALGLFGAGFFTGLSGKAILSELFSKKNSAKLMAQKLSNEASKHPVQREMWVSWNDTLAAVFGLAVKRPEYRNTLFAYSGTLGLGFVLGNLLQGVQETWVRLEETKIRARLIQGLETVFRTSIQTKQRMDTRLLESAEACIRGLLFKHQVPRPNDLVRPEPVVEPKIMLQKYFYEPTHRSLPVGFDTARARFGQQNTDRSTFPASDVINVGLFVGGVITGVLAKGFINLLSNGVKSSATEKFIMKETINAKDMEAMFIYGMLKERWVLAGFLFLVAASRIGGYLINGLREINVTRVNAMTEYRYQKHNWMAMDPQFHQIAEQEGLRVDLQKLDMDMPWLKTDRASLKQRIQTILTNVGRNSAPKYFPMTPMVNLVEARS